MRFAVSDGIVAFAGIRGDVSRDTADLAEKVEYDR